MRRLLVVLAAAASVALAACTSGRGELTAPPVGGSDPTAPTGEAAREAPETVGIIGDSITVGSEEAVVAAVEALGVEVVAVDAASGRRLVADGTVGSGVDAARRVAAVDPDVWVVALGTNDVPNLEAQEDYAVAIDRMLREVPEDVPLVWVDVYVEWDETATAAFNRVLRDRVDARGSTVVVDWAARAAAEDLLRDGVHPTERGGLVFADLVAAGVATWLT
jgi:lysophospholipase L1-like esterase